MIEWIVRNISKPHLIPGKAIKKIQTAYISYFYDENVYIEEQSERFKKLDLNYFETHSVLDKLYKKDDRLKVDMTSCHHNLFVALSKKHQFKNILEIGTHSGAGAVILSRLFPKSKILTIDLPDDHPIYLNTYNRSEKDTRLDFIRQRDELLRSRNNIEFKQMNSLGLTFSYDNFDLIWIDGAHGYPVVTADIVNSLNLVNENGLVVCDDVYKSINKSDEMYCSVASYETIRQLYNANLINYSLILKRTIKPWGSPQFRKYIAVLEKCNDVNK